MATADDLRWYHTIDLPGGDVTPGYYDLRAVPAKLPFPDLRGRRCLDVATANGFWAFEMERRGAAEVIAIDIDDAAEQDWPRPPDPSVFPSGGRDLNKRAFEAAHAARGSGVVRHNLSVYDISPEHLGTFDFVFIGSALLHLRDPTAALRAAGSVLDGQLLSLEPVILWLSMVRRRSPAGQLHKSHEPNWWTPNVAGHRAWIERAGLRIADSGAFVFQRFGRGFPAWPDSVRPFDPSWLAFWFGVRRVGVPSAWVLASPGAAQPSSAGPVE
jgi:tRNA (mo5U34)-methyltransferase